VVHTAAVRVIVGVFWNDYIITARLARGVKENRAATTTILVNLALYNASTAHVRRLIVSQDRHVIEASVASGVEGC